MTKDETVVLNQRIQVAHNLDPLNELIRAVHPESVAGPHTRFGDVCLEDPVPAPFHRDPGLDVAVEQAQLDGLGDVRTQPEMHPVRGQGRSHR